MQAQWVAAAHRVERGAYPRRVVVLRAQVRSHDMTQTAVQAVRKNFRRRGIAQMAMAAADARLQ